MNNTPAPLVSASPRIKEAGGMMRDREAAWGGAGVAEKGEDYVSRVRRRSTLYGPDRMGRNPRQMGKARKRGSSTDEGRDPEFDCSQNDAHGHLNIQRVVWCCSRGTQHRGTTRHPFQLPFGARLRRRSDCAPESRFRPGVRVDCREEHTPDKKRGRLAPGPQPTITRPACPDGRGGAFRISKRRPASASLHAGHGRYSGARMVRVLVWSPFIFRIGAPAISQCQTWPAPSRRGRSFPGD